MNRFRQLLPWGLVLLLLGWSVYGVWPVSPVEGDEQGVLFGVAGMLKHDALLLQMRYTYYLQPGYYQLLVGLTRLTGLTPELLFAATTVIGALGFAAAGAGLVQRLLGWPVAWALAAMLWCQEVTTAAFYMNTSALPGALAILALLLTCRPQHGAWIGAGLLLAVAGWMREDSLMIAPACLGLAIWQGKPWRPALIQTTVIAAVSVAAFLALCWVSGAALADSFAVYGKRGFMHTDWRTFALVFPLLLSPALALAGLAGLVLFLRPRWHKLGLVFACGVAASLLAHGSELTTPKYFYYIIPFLLLPALVVVDELVRGASVGLRGVTGFTAAAVLLADGALGLRTIPEKQRRFQAVPTLAIIHQIPHGDRVFTLVVGSGELIINVDGFRLRTGKWFAPLNWHREKQLMQADLALLRSWVAGPGEMTVYCSGWLCTQMATRELLAAGFQRPKHHTREFGVATNEEWRREDRVVLLTYLGFADAGPPVPAPAPAGSRTLFVSDEASRPPRELSDGLHWHLLSPVPQGFITLRERR